MVRLSTPILDMQETCWPLIEIPKPKLSGHTYNRLPFLRPPPRADKIPVALHVCRASRQIVLRRLVLFPTKLRPGRVSARRQRFEYAGMDDIIEIGTLEPQKALLDDLEIRFDRRLDSIRHLVDTISVPYDVFSVVKGVKMLYDLGTHHFTVMIELDFLPINPADGVVRASLVSQWFFGSKITIGHVPQILRYFNAQPSAKWIRFMQFYDGDIPAPNAKFHAYSDPLFLLKSYIWLLHKMAEGPNHFRDFSLERAGYANAYGILNIFVAVMDGYACPVCQIRVLDVIRERFPQLSLELVDIVFLVIPSHDAFFQAFGSTWLEPRSIPIDALLLS